MSFADVNTASQLRELISGLVSNEIARQRPEYRYGLVESIDYPQRKCRVVLNGDVDAVPVSMGSIQPATTGQVVRVDGKPGDRYVADVMGPVRVGAGELTADSVAAISINSPIINGDNYFKPPAAIYERTTPLGVASNVLTNIPMNSGPLQNLKNGTPLVGLVSGSSTTFIAHHTGWHEFSVNHEWPSTFAQAHRLGEVIVNGGPRHFLYVAPANPGFVSRLSGWRVIYLEQGDTFIFRVRQAESGSSELTSGIHSIKWLSE
jgi:hypothetical protein